MAYLKLDMGTVESLPSQVQPNQISLSLAKNPFLEGQIKPLTLTSKNFSVEKATKEPQDRIKSIIPHLTNIHHTQHHTPTLLHATSHTHYHPYNQAFEQLLTLFDSTSKK